MKYNLVHIHCLHNSFSGKQGNDEVQQLTAGELNVVEHLSA